MKNPPVQKPKSMVRVVGLLVLGFVLSDAQHAAAQQACPLAAGESPPAGPRVTAQQVEYGRASLADFGLAVRDRYKTLSQEVRTVEGILHFACLVRQEGSDYRSGSTYLVVLTPDGRVLSHAKSMAFSGRQLNPFVYTEILSALGVPSDVLANLASPDPDTVDQASTALISMLAQEPDGTFDATIPISGLRPGIPGASGHAAVYLSSSFSVPRVMVTGFDLNESHLTNEVLDYGDPTVTAREVVDRETLKTFVTEALHFFVTSHGSLDPAASLKARIALRDPNGPWRHGSVYLYVLDRASNLIVFHGAFPDRFELRPLVPTVRDVVTGKLVLSQVIEAATSGPEGGFVEYYWDDPSDDSDRADIPKVGYAREFSGTVERADGTIVPVNLIVGSGFYGKSPAGGPTMTSRCADRNIAASAVSTQRDIHAFVECAAAYLAEHGTVEARRAFNEDKRWKDGSLYVFVQQIARSGTEAKTYVFPPDPSRENRLWGASIDGFGTDLFSETYRMMALVDSGWTYYLFPDPANGRQAPKTSYMIEVDWDGEAAVIGAGLYSRDLPGTCFPDEVNAAAVTANPDEGSLQEFVRCAALEVESRGYSAKQDLEGNPRWTDGENYIYVQDMTGHQLMSGSRVRVNGRALHEWSRGTGGDQFGGRDMISVGNTFGEAHVYYRSYDPSSGADRPKAGFLKRVVAQGVPVLVGSGHRVQAGRAATAPGCADNFVTAAGIRTQGDVEAFVRCAAEYVTEHGEEEARRAFNEDARWKSGPTYVFVDALRSSGAEAESYVFPPDPSMEGSAWSPLVDAYGTDYFYELDRILSIADSGWIYYNYTNPDSGNWQPKSSYVMEIDWNGDRATIGAGIYARDLPGTCEPGEVNAARLAADPSDGALQEFVRCAALVVESSGYFAGPVLSRDSRWSHGPIYIFGVNAETGTIEFSGNEASFAASGRIPELLFEGRDMITATASFGESFWYYTGNNPSTGEDAAKVSFVRLVRAQGVQLLVGAGYYPPNR